MLKITSAFFFSTALFSAAVHAMGQEQQWGNWFGTVNAMEFELNTDNSAGEHMTLTCRDSHLMLNYSGSDKKPLGVPDEGHEAMGININAVHYLPGKAAFTALKNTDSHGQIEITRMNKPLSCLLYTSDAADDLQPV